jgi:primosomal protein N' (replication factor Y)
MKKKTRLVEVAVDAPVKAPLTYSLPESMAGEALVGKRLIVPLSRRKVTGYVIGFPDRAPVPEPSLKPAIEVIDPEPLFDQCMLNIFRFASRYYFCALAEVIKAALPAGINTSSRRVARITESGAELLMVPDPAAFKRGAGEPALSASELDLLETLFQEGPLEIAKDQDEAGGRSIRRALKRLSELGLVEEEEALGRARVSEKTESAIVLEQTPSDADLARLSRRAPEQARLAAELAGKGCVSLKDLRERYKDPGRLARALCAAGLARAVKLRACRDPFAMDLPLEPAPGRLMPEQEKAVREISAALEPRAFRSFMLQGVTGSGKTEVYLRVIEKALGLGRGAIMLVPEIALTPQLISRFRQRFPAERTAVLHSGLSAGERHDEWWRIKRGEAQIAIGARSAVFAPVRDLGIIVVDEEQDSAYKQDHGFMYNGRDLAVKRAQEEGAVAVLGSATPSMESAHRSRQDNGYTILHLPSRVDGRVMPMVEIVDLRARPGQDRSAPAPAAVKVQDRDRMAARELISQPLREAVHSTLERGEQAILFLNRRGIASFLICFDCGARFTCPNCEVSLTHHRVSAAKTDESCGRPDPAGHLLCHYCGYHEPVPRVCPRCRGVRVFPFGVGTEQMEAVTAEVFPKARVMRMDSDVMTGRDSYFRLLDQICRRQVDIVVGTQMVAKGHDLPGVTLVGVLLADMSLNVPDFRSGERTFQMLTQVAGRAGRGTAPGRVIIQTFNPEHYAVKLARGQDFEAFYEQEWKVRKALWYPPFARLANFRFSGLKADKVRQAASFIGAVARRKAQTKTYQGRVRILGPAQAPIGRIKGKSRWMMMVKSDSHETMTSFLEAVSPALRDQHVPRSVRVEIDRDPVFLL